MLKLISVLVAICAMTVSINVQAATSDGIIDGTTRNDINTMSAEISNTDSLPTLRAGDILKFNVSNLTDGTTLTLISYKYDSDFTNSTVQYINEYDISASQTETDESGEPVASVSPSQIIEYTIRDITDGIYKIVLNGNDKKEVANFYYKVGTPKVSIVKGADDTNYYVSDVASTSNGTNIYSVAFVGKATIGGGVSFEDAGLESVGLEFNLEDKTTGETYFEDLTKEQMSALLPELNEIQKQDINGSVTLYFGVTMYRIPEQDLGKIKATPRLDGVAVSVE